MGGEGCGKGRGEGECQETWRTEGCERYMGAPEEMGVELLYFYTKKVKR